MSKYFTRWTLRAGAAGMAALCALAAAPASTAAAAAPRATAAAGTAAAAPTVLSQGSVSRHVATLGRYLDCSSRGDFYHLGAYSTTFSSLLKGELSSWQYATRKTVTGKITVGDASWAQLAKEATTCKRAATDIDARSIAYSKRYRYAVDISKSDRKLRLLKDGKVILTADARFGGWHGSVYHATREGAFKAFRKGGADYVSSTYRTPMPYPLFFSGGEATHYSPDFARVGYNGSSHGCVNLRVLSAAKQVNALALGTRIVVHW